MTAALKIAESHIETAEVFEPLLQDARYLAAKGGRGSGKSQFFAGLSVEKLLEEPSEKIVCIREIQATLDQSVKALIEMKIREVCGRSSNRYFQVRKTHIETWKEGLIIFRGMQSYNAYNINSLEGFKYAWVEEAQAMSQTSLDLLRPTIRRPQSQIWLSWNPTNENDPVDKFIMKDMKGNPDLIAVTANWRDNPWFPAELEKERQWDFGRDRDKYLHVWEGSYRKRSGAAVFTKWKVEPVNPQKLGIKVFLWGGDFGFANDPTVLICCFIKDRTLYIWREAWKVGCEIDDTPALFDSIENGMGRRWPIICDSARPETISYLRRKGYDKARSAIKGKNSVEEGVKFIQNYDIVVDPSCVRTIDELTHYSHEIDRHTGEVLPVLKDEKNHCIDSIRYALESERRARAGVW